MAITPTKAEIEEMSAVLNDTTFKDDEAMAKGLLNKAWSLFQDRDLWAVLLWVSKKAEGRPLVYGFESTEHQARQLAQSLAFGTYALVPVKSLVRTIEGYTELEESGWGKKKEAACSKCGHAASLHSKRVYSQPVVQGRRQKILKGITGCLGCKCQGLEEEKAA